MPAVPTATNSGSYAVIISRRCQMTGRLPLDSLLMMTVRLGAEYACVDHKPVLARDAAVRGLDELRLLGLHAAHEDGAVTGDGAPRLQVELEVRARRLHAPADLSRVALERVRRLEVRVRLVAGAVVVGDRETAADVEVLEVDVVRRLDARQQSQGGLERLDVRC